MKNFTILTIFWIIPAFIFGQEATFNWKSETISEGNTLQGMTLAGDSSAVIIGYNNTFKKKSNSSDKWINIDVIKPEYDFIGLGSNNGTTLISSRKYKIIDHPSGGKPDVYVSGGILKTTDMGESWSLVDVSKIGSGDDPTVNPNAEGAFGNDYYSVGVFNADSFLIYNGWSDISTGSKESRGGIFLTKDGGENWENIVSGLGSKIVTSIAVKDSVAISGGNNILYKTNILADTTIDIYPNLAIGTDSNLYVYAIKMISPETFYLTTTSDGVFKTTDGGNTFTFFNGIGGGNDVLPLNDSSIIVLGNSSKSKISTDYGATWTDCYPGSTSWKIGGVLGDTLYGLAKTYAYKIAVSDLLQKNFNWKSTELNPNDNLQKMCIYDNDNAIIVGYSNMCKKTTDGGLTWAQVNLPDFVEDIDFDFKSISNNSLNAFSTVRKYKIANFPSDSEVNDFYMDGLVFKTTDNWETFSLIDISKIGADEGNDVTLNPQLDSCYGLDPLTIKCIDTNTAYLYADWRERVTTGDEEIRGRVFKTTDGGESWFGITQDLGSSYVNSIEFVGDTGYVGGVKVFLKTIDGGANFVDLYPKLLALNEGDSTIIVNSFSMVNNNEFYVITTTDGVFKTSDGGETFSKLDGVNGTNDMYILDSNSFMLLGTTSKSYFTNDDGVTWQDPSIGKTIYNIGEIFNDSLYALGSGIVYKIAVTDLDIKTSVKDIALSNELQIQYSSDHINLVSKNNNTIEKCLIYSVNGQLIDIKQPFSNVCRLNNYEYKPGIYIVAVSIHGERFTDKIVFK